MATLDHSNLYGFFSFSSRNHFRSLQASEICSEHAHDGDSEASVQSSNYEFQLLRNCKGCSKLYTIENALHPETNRTWKLQLDVKTRPRLYELYDFLERGGSGCVFELADVENWPRPKRCRFTPSSSSSHGRVEQKLPHSISACTLCEGTHRLY